MPLLLPNDIEPLTPADAVEVEQNYGVIEQYVNTQLINRDGSVAMTAPLTLAGAPTQDLHAATKAYVDALMPIGIIMPFGGAAAPAGQWALCNGASLPTNSYPKLFSVLGYRYGGSGGTFNVPNLNGRLPVGVDATQTRFSTTGKTGGSWAAALPLHQHSITHTHEHFHTHSIAHDHPEGNTGVDGDHTHNLEYNKFDGLAETTGAGYFLAQRIADVGTMVQGTSTAPTHGHTFNVANYAGNSGQPSEATTGPASTSVSGNAGTASVEQVPPFIVLNYIIRVDG